MDGYSAQADQIANQVAISIANWSTAMAVESIKWLLASLGQASEPDLAAIVPIYDRMLAISLLLTGGIVALALIERIAWGSLGTSLVIVPRVLAGTFFAYSGLGLVKYVAAYSALLATAWSPDFNKLTDTLLIHVASSDAASQAATTGAQVSTFGLIVTALSLSSLTVMVHLELVVRSALILTIASFVPLVSVMSIWPRLAKAATTLSEFLIGLLLSKFVVATAVYVGFRLVVSALVSPTNNDATENWMASGVAVLLIAAFSPVVIFTSLRFAHAQAGSVARSLTGAGLSFVPTGRLLGNASRLTQPLVRSARRRLTARITRLRPRP
ncbi:MAG: hypothetical protein E6J20_03995 [Chloroflexi bacterium]|nr:MAG: hypothetical protein E6J20_03995 [Chloroflexota bacterium]